MQSHGVIKGMTYRTATNVADGLQALWTCIEVYNFCNYPLRMSLISQKSDGFIRCTHDVVFHFKEYRALCKDCPHTNPLVAFLHSLNYWEFIQEAAASIVFFFKVSPHKSQIRRKFESAFHIGVTFGTSSSLNVDKQMREVG